MAVRITKPIKKIYHYVRKDKREIVLIYYEDGTHTTMSYPKYLMGLKLGRELAPKETVHHNDHDVTNNSFDNFKVIDRLEHIKNDCRRLSPQRFVCPTCNREIIMSGQQLHDAISNRRRGQAGPFCNKHCAGIYGSNIREHRTTKLKVTPIIPKYTRLAEVHQ